jgi:hypothetical protein
MTKEGGMKINKVWVCPFCGEKLADEGDLSIGEEKQCLGCLTYVEVVKDNLEEDWGQDFGEACKYTDAVED